MLLSAIIYFILNIVSPAPADVSQDIFKNSTLQFKVSHDCVRMVPLSSQIKGTIFDVNN